MMQVAIGKWEKQPLPDLNVARYAHGSLGLADQVFVACGEGNNHPQLNSVEVLRLGEQAWSLVVLPDLTPRSIPLFCQINLDDLCILGGFSPSGMEKDGVILNHKTGTVTKIDPDC